MDDVDILLVEDNHGDVRLVEQAFERRDLPGTLHVVQTGERALDRLRRREEFAEAPRIDLVLLDLNLPATNGLDVLSSVKSDSRLRRTPVIVLTSTKSTEDLVEAYERSANACLLKPVDPEEFADRIESLAEFWVSTATLPPDPGNSGTDEQ